MALTEDVTRDLDERRDDCHFGFKMANDMCSWMVIVTDGESGEKRAKYQNYWPVLFVIDCEN